MKGRDVILGLLAEKPLSGYDIKQVFEDIFSYFFDGSYGMIYPTLRQLEKEGKIVKRVIVQDGKPNKNQYHITESGRLDFLNYLDQKVESDVLRSDFLMRMYYGEYVEKSRLAGWVKDEIKQKQSKVAALKKNYIGWEPHMSLPQKLSLDVGISTYEAEIRTLSRYLNEIEIKEEDDIP